MQDKKIGPHTKKQNISDYRELYQGDDFEFEAQYAKILTYCYVCLLYSSGIPLLYPITLFLLCLQYCMDKWYIVRHCRKPDNNLQKLPKAVRNFMFPMILFHTIFAIWSYSHSAIFDSLQNF